MRAMYMYGGGRMCFPVRDCRCLPESHCIFHRSCSLVLRSLFLSGRPDEFSRSRSSTSTSPLLHSSFLLISTRSSCASMVWSDTVFGVSGCSRTGLCGLVATHFGCHRCMFASWIFPDHIRGEVRARIPAEFRARVFKPLSAPAVP